MCLKWIISLCLAVQGLQAGVRLISPQPIDMGKVLEKTVVEGRFRLVNESDSTFHIQFVRPSCGCTVVSIPDSTLDPQDTVFVPYSINTTRFNGIIRKTITVQFEENIPEIEATVQVQVFQKIEMHPRILSCRNLKVGSEPVSKSFSMFNNSLRPLTIRSAQADDSTLTVTPLKTLIPPMEEVVFEVRFSPVRLGSKPIFITFETDDAESPTIKFPVSVQVVP